MNQDQDITTKFQENQKLKNKWMNEALKEAKKAYEKMEVPVGAVVVYQNKIIARDHNRREKSQTFYAHAEFLAMQKASKKLGTWRLEDCDVYVTMEPCPMCAGAMIQARVRNLFYAAKDPKAGVAESVFNMFSHKFNHVINVEGGIMEKESQEMIKAFFKTLRNK
jgi:tRNA(adenine34) deaminase